MEKMFWFDVYDKKYNKSDGNNFVIVLTILNSTHGNLFSYINEPDE